MIWTKEKLKQLIEMLRKAPALWNMKCKEYKDRKKKANEVKNMAAHFNISEEEIWKKIASLKTQFRRQHKKKLKGENEESKEWFGYSPLTFLLANSKSNGNYSNMEDDTDEGDNASTSGGLDASAEIDVVNSDNDVHCIEINGVDSHSSTSELPVEKIPVVRCKRSDSNQVEEANKRIQKSNSNQVEEMNKFMRKSNCNQVEEMNKIIQNASISPVEDTNNFMYTLKDNIYVKDIHSVYGENVAARMRDAGRSSRATAIARNHIDNILFKLEMGYFDKSQ